MPQSLEASIPSNHYPPHFSKPFLDSFLIEHGPHALLGAYFLKSVEVLSLQGIELTREPLASLAGTFERHHDSWPFFMPTHDDRVTAVAPEDVICLVGRDGSGRTVCAVASRRFNADGSSLMETVNNGKFFSIRPECNPHNIQARITAPIAAQLSGELAYAGSVWVHPELRGLHLASHLIHLVNACSIAIWGSVWLLGLVRSGEIGSALHKRYGYPHNQASFSVSRDGMDFIQAHLLWGSQEELLDSIDRQRRVLLAQIDGAAASRNRKQHAAGS